MPEGNCLDSFVVLPIRGNLTNLTLMMLSSKRRHLSVSSHAWIPTLAGLGLTQSGQPELVPYQEVRSSWNQKLHYVSLRTTR